MISTMSTSEYNAACDSVICALEHGHFVFCLSPSLTDSPIAFHKHDNVLYSYIAVYDNDDHLVLQIAGARQYSKSDMPTICDQVFQTNPEIRIDSKNLTCKDKIKTGAWSHERVIVELSIHPHAVLTQAP